MELALIEIAKALIILSFDYMRTAGKTDAEVEAYRKKVHEWFMTLPSAKDLPDV